VGDKVPLKILRNREEMQVECELNRPLMLIARGQYDVRPPFMLVGGILFQPLSLEFLQVRARCRTYLQNEIIRRDGPI